MKTKQLTWQPWTDDEKALLVHFVKMALKQNKTIKEGCQFASRKLGRTAAACQAMYHTNLKAVLPSIAVQPNKAGQPEKEKSVRIMYHNGTSKEAEIIVNTDSYIVAKCGDAVITVDKV